jgi:hypothetical protein
MATTTTSAHCGAGVIVMGKRTTTTGSATTTKPATTKRGKRAAAIADAIAGSAITTAPAEPVVATTTTTERAAAGSVVAIVGGVSVGRDGKPAEPVTTTTTGSATTTTEPAEPAKPDTTDRHKPAKDAAALLYIICKSRAAGDVAGVAMARALFATTAPAEPVVMADALELSGSVVPDTLAGLRPAYFTAARIVRAVAIIATDYGALMADNVKVGDYAALITKRITRADLENALRKRGYATTPAK